MKIVLASVLLVVLSWSAHGGLIRVSDESIVSDLSTESSLVLDVIDGKLFGAFNVDFSGTLYDVAFVDGVFSDIFGDGSELYLSTREQARMFVSSLGNLVFIDSGIGLFDSAPSLTNGCNLQDQSFCNIIHSYDARHPYFYLETLANHPGSQKYGIGSGYDTFDLNTVGENMVFADWSLSPARGVSVPSPSGLMLLGFGVAGVMLNRRKVLGHHQSIKNAD